MTSRSTPLLYRCKTRAMFLARDANFFSVCQVYSLRIIFLSSGRVVLLYIDLIYGSQRKCPLPCDALFFHILAPKATMKARSSRQDDNAPAASSCMVDCAALFAQVPSGPELSGCQNRARFVMRFIVHRYYFFLTLSFMLIYPRFQGRVAQLFNSGANDLICVS